MPDAAGTTVPVDLGVGGELIGWPLLTFVITLLLTITLMVRNIRGAILIAVLSGTVLAHVLEAVAPSGSSAENPAGWSLVVPSTPTGLFSLPDLSLVGEADPVGLWTQLGVTTVLLLIFTILLSIFFDAMGTMVGLSEQAGLVKVKEGVNPARISELDLAANPHKLKFVALEAAQLPRVLEDADYVVVNGNFAVSSGLKLSDAVVLAD